MIPVNRLIWDGRNIAHIARHEVSPDEIEEVCKAQPVTSETYGGRIRVVGHTQDGKTLTIILAPKGQNTYYTVTARPSSRKERKMYEIRKGGEQAA